MVLKGNLKQNCELSKSRNVIYDVIVPDGYVAPEDNEKENKSKEVKTKEKVSHKRDIDDDLETISKNEKKSKVNNDEEIDNTNELINNSLGPSIPNTANLSQLMTETIYDASIENVPDDYVNLISSVIASFQYENMIIVDNVKKVIYDKQPDAIHSLDKVLDYLEKKNKIMLDCDNDIGQVIYIV